MGAQQTLPGLDQVVVSDLTGLDSAFALLSISPCHLYLREAVALICPRGLHLMKEELGVLFPRLPSCWFLQILSAGLQWALVGTALQTFGNIGRASLSWCARLVIPRPNRLPQSYGGSGSGVGVRRADRTVLPSPGTCASPWRRWTSCSWPVTARASTSSWRVSSRWWPSCWSRRSPTCRSSAPTQ